MPLLHTERGAPMLEMLLFTPLAILLLFVGVDFGLAHLETGNLTNAVRSGMTRDSYCSKQLLSAGKIAVDSIRLSATEQDELLRCIAREISNNVTHSTRVGTGLPTSSYQVAISLVTLQIDPDSGKLLNQNSRAVALSAEDSGSFEVPHEAQLRLTDRDAYLERTLQSEATLDVSRYALPLAQIYDTSNPSYSSLRYAGSALMVHVELVALPRSIGRSFVDSMLGRSFVIQVQEVTPLRMQLY